MVYLRGEITTAGQVILILGLHLRLPLLASVNAVFQDVSQSNARVSPNVPTSTHLSTQLLHFLPAVKCVKRYLSRVMKAEIPVLWHTRKGTCDNMNNLSNTNICLTGSQRQLSHTHTHTHTHNETERKLLSKREMLHYVCTIKLY